MGFDVDRRYPARSHSLAQDGRVVSGSCPDLKHRLLISEVEQFEHSRHQTRLGARTARASVVIKLGDERVVRIDKLQPLPPLCRARAVYEPPLTGVHSAVYVRHERMARSALECRL